MRKKILGLNSGGPNTAAILLVDGKIVYAVEEVSVDDSELGFVSIEFNFAYAWVLRRNAAKVIFASTISSVYFPLPFKNRLSSRRNIG